MRLSSIFKTKIVKNLTKVILESSYRVFYKLNSNEKPWNNSSTF